jgi:hypothetical protein
MDACTGASRADGRPGPRGGTPPAAEPPFVRVCAGRDRRTPSARCRIFLACKFGSCYASFVFIRCGVYLLTSSAALHGGFPVAVRLEKVQYCPMTAETDIARGRRSDRRGGGTAKTFLTSARKQPGYSRSSPVMSCAARRFSGCRSSLTSWSQSRWKWPSWTSRASRGKSKTRAQAAGPPAQGHGGGTVPGMHPGGHRVRR